MTGRGRGRGSNLTFNAELLGVGRGQEPPPSCVLDPPLIYPSLPTKPKQPPNKAEHVYLTAVRKDFINRMMDSQYFITTEKKSKLDLDWKRFPAELAPSSSSSSKKKRGASGAKPNLNSKRRVSGGEDIKKKLDELENREKNENDGTGAKSGGEDDDSDEDAEGQKDQGSDVEGDEADEEMDDDTDYAKDYFDNGEGYLDEEEDNLDEGGIY